MIQRFTKRWGPTLLLALAVAGPLWVIAAKIAPVGLFLIRGSSRLGLVETDIGEIKRRQKDQCQTDYAALWWMTAISRTNGWVEPPDPLQLLAHGCNADQAMMQALPPRRDIPGWMDVYAAPAGAGPAP